MLNKIHKNIIQQLRKYIHHKYIEFYSHTYATKRDENEENGAFKFNPYSLTKTEGSNGNN